MTLGIHSRCLEMMNLGNETFAVFVKTPECLELVKQVYGTRVYKTSTSVLLLCLRQFFLQLLDRISDFRFEHRMIRWLQF